MRDNRSRTKELMTEVVIFQAPILFTYPAFTTFHSYPHDLIRKTHLELLYNGPPLTFKDISTITLTISHLSSDPNHHIWVFLGLPD